MAALLGVLRLAFGPSSPSPVDILMRLPQDQTDQVSLTTDDVAEAARWLRQTAGVPAQTLNLEDVGAHCVGAQAFPAARRGALLYETRRGLVIGVYYLPAVPSGLEKMKRERLADRTVRVGASQHPALSVVAWEDGVGMCFVAAAVEPESLYPVAESVLEQSQPARAGSGVSAAAR